MRAALASLAVIAAAACPAAAQSGKGVAIVLGGESGGGVCVAETPEKGFACAIDKCAAEGVDRESCEPQAWCFPAGWSVDLFIQSKQGAHFHEMFCGWPSRDAALKAARLRCDAYAGVHEACWPVTTYDPQGTRAEVR